MKKRCRNCELAEAKAEIARLTLELERAQRAAWTWTNVPALSAPVPGSCVIHAFPYGGGPCMTCGAPQATYTKGGGK